MNRNAGMPFFDIIVLKDLPKSAALPLGTLIEAKRRLSMKMKTTLNSASSNTKSLWDFKYLYYTESDQVGFIVYKKIGI